VNGLQAAKSMAVGAHCAGTARAVLREALESPQAVKERLSLMMDEMRITMFLTGSRNVRELGRVGYMLTGASKEWASADLEG